MSDPYPSNASQPPPNQRAPRQKQAPVVTNVGIRKKSIASRFFSRAENVWSDVFIEVIKPMFLETFAESLHASVDGAVYNKTGHRLPNRRPSAHGRPGQQVSPSGYVVTDYQGMYSSPAAPAAKQYSNVYDPRDSPFDFSVYTFDEFGAGQELIDRLRHLVYTYHRATANDLYDLLNKSGTIDSTGENYGWDTLEEIDTAAVKRVRGGGAYYLDLPPAHPIKP